RVKFPPRGLLGGQAGAAGTDYLNAERIPAKVRLDIQRDDVVTFDTPGGGGFGPPDQRDPEKIRGDVASGLVTAAKAKRDYGVEISGADADG
ncbi:MAG: hydantoinase B/oxoprolinase family protein, partial [Rhodospirillaceae bacterium]|nr:hydantoinase B/oxoprolinase family protein [Rhodospirillaceae bacterium]